MTEHSTDLQGLAAITLFVDDLAAGKAFYADVLGLPTVYEDEESVAFHLGGTTVNLLHTEAAGALVAPATVGGPGTSVRAQMTVPVADVDAVCGRLAARGVEPLNGPVDRPWGLRTAAFADPAGHVWELAQDLPG